jgi:2-dehydropantoate 2-reductase
VRILIVGAGALGGLVGAFLTRAGEDVTLLEVNPARARLLAKSGLEITQVGVVETISVPVNVVTSLDGLAPFDLVFIAVKTYQTGDAVRATLTATHPGTRFLSMQNGVGNTEVIAGLVGPSRVVCGLTYHSAQHGGPGRLQFRAGIKPIQLAPYEGAITPEIEAIGAMFRNARLDTDIMANIDHAVWQKVLHNAVINPVSAITGLTCREMLGDEDLLAFMRDLCGEVVAVMRARGIPVVDPEDPFRPLLQSLQALGANRPTMWQDLLRGVRTEVDALNGAVVAEADRLGLSVPHNRALVRFIHSRERHKFLNRQAVSQKLGLGPAPISGVDPTIVPAGGGARRARTGPADGRRASRPQLESAIRLKELVHEYYHDLGVASESPDRLIAYCSGLAPVEIARALGVTPYFPENHAALIAAAHLSQHYLARASSAGFSQFSSSAMRSDIGALLAGTTPLTAAHGLKGPPRPDVVIYSTNTGHEFVRWFDYHGAHYGVPVLGLHPPPALDEFDRTDVDASVHQLLRLTAQLERTAGRGVDMDRLGETVGYTAEAARLWGSILDLACAVPAPITVFDTLVHMAPMVLLRGTPEAVAYYRLLKAEVEDRVLQGVGAVPGETQRFYWDGPPIWYALRPLAQLFADRGIAVTASTYCENFTLPGLDPDDPIESLARTYAAVFSNRSGNYQSAYLAEQFAKHSVDAAVYHDCRTAPDARHVRTGLAAHVERLTEVRGIVIEADSHDERLLSLDRLQGQLAEFIEQRRERFAGHTVVVAATGTR